MAITQRDAVLLAADPSTSDFFGSSLALSDTGTMLAVGVNRWDVLSDQGGVYIYDYSGAAWVQRGAVLVAGDAALTDYFGVSVSLSDAGTILAVGANRWEGALSDQGGVYIYDWDGTAWVQRGAVLVAADGAANDWFGVSVSLSSTGTILAVGASQWEGGLSDQGGVYIYDWDGTAWVQRGAVLVAGDAVASDLFGSSVSLSDTGTVLVVGAKQRATSQGGVYIYDWNGTAWVQRGAVLVAADGAASDLFGSSVVLSGDGLALVVGATQWEGALADQGGVYIYDYSGAAWVQRGDVLVAGDALASDFFGAAVALSSTILAVGANGRDTGITDQGGVYIYNGAVILSDGAIAESAAAVDTLTDSAFTFYIESAGLSDILSGGANTTSFLSDSAVLTDIIQQAINQIVTDTANGADTLNLGAALALVDVANAVATQTSTYNSVMLVAELIATLEAFNSVASEDITESSALSDAYAARVEALVAMLEAAQAVDTNTALVHVMQSAADTANGTIDITSAGSLLNALLTDTALATIRINIGGEMFTGWVLNTDTLAPSEYQFADLQFNSACKHGDAYLMAADDGIHQFTNEFGVETVMTYIKTGKMDFGSDKHKRVINSYMVYSATGQMMLKVTTSENGQIRTHSYQMAPFANHDTTDTRRFDIGKGLKSRYWQFELVGDGAGCEFDEIGMLPVVLSRRI